MMTLNPQPSKKSLITRGREYKVSAQENHPPRRFNTKHLCHSQKPSISAHNAVSIPLPLLLLRRSSRWPLPHNLSPELPGLPELQRIPLLPYPHPRTNEQKPA